MSFLTTHGGGGGGRGGGVEISHPTLETAHRKKCVANKMK